MICLCESETILVHAHLYTRRIYPGVAFDEATYRSVLAEMEISTMRQLFALDDEGRRHLANRVIAYSSKPAVADAA